MSRYENLNIHDILNSDAKYTNLLETSKQRSNFEVFSAITALLFLFGLIAFLLLIFVVLDQPQWIVSDQSSQAIPYNNGFMGLFRRCIAELPDDVMYCVGKWWEINSVSSTPFRIAAVFMELACCFTILAILVFLLLLCIKMTIVFSIITILLFLAFISAFISIVVYPAGWYHPHVKLICGDNASPYRLGSCSLGWTYIIAIILTLIALLLTTLSMLLASAMYRSIRYQQREARHLWMHSSIYKFMQRNRLKKHRKNVPKRNDLNINYRVENLMADNAMPNAQPQVAPMGNNAIAVTQETKI
ncbi:hypothetical protein SNEBB_003324 [Seison nebaliae]|nr:hypothetical protein SNEBB_003324 [Seison nebaliae]